MDVPPKVADRELAAIRRIAEVGHAAEPEEMLPRLLDIMVEATASDCAALFLLDSRGIELSLAAVVGYDGPLLERYRRVGLASARAGLDVPSGEPRAASVEDIDEPARSEMREAGFSEGASLPITAKGRVAGTLNLARRARRAFTSDELASAKMLAGEVAVHVQNARLFAEATRRARDLSLINELGSVIAEQLDLKAVLSVGVDLLARIAEAPQAFLLLREGDRLRMAASNVERALDVVIGPDEPSVAALSLSERRPILVVDARHNPRVSQKLVHRFGETSLLALPLVTRGEALGAVLIAHTAEDARFEPAEVDRAVALANQLATAIANARLYEQAKESYAELRRAQEHLVRRERLAALGELAAVVAHEVRNPLAVIFNSLASLRRDAPGAQSGMLLGIVAEEAGRINRIISDLLDFARPGEARLEPESLEAVLGGALEAATHTLEGRAACISLEVPSPMPPVAADAQLLRQALINLLINALQANPNGSVCVRANVTERAGARWACVDVFDDGPGIADDDRDQIFQPFFTTKAQGTGLGLAIVRRIAEAHHGEVEFDSMPGRGSVFTLRIPLA